MQHTSKRDDSEAEYAFELPAGADSKWRDMFAADFAAQQDEDDERECRAERVAMLRSAS